MNEIAFINSMEAENRKMELMSKEQMAEEKQKEIQVLETPGIVHHSLRENSLVVSQSR